MSGTRTSLLPEGCTEDTRVQSGDTLQVYVVAMNDPKGGDLPGARQGQIAYIVLNRKDKHVNVIDALLAEELQEALALLEQPTRVVDVVVVLSIKESGFCAGADIDQMYKETSEDQVKDTLRKVFTALDRLAGLPVPSMAILHGACLGGGYELALACTLRVAAEGAAVGLPEVRMGLIPGAGGIIRLPKLIGLQNSLRIILRGRPLQTHAAYEERMVDFIVEARAGKAGTNQINRLIWDVFVRSPTIILRHGVTRKEAWMEGTMVGQRILKWLSFAAVDKEADGHFPAPYVALETMMQCHVKSDRDAVNHMVNATAAMAVCRSTKTFMRLWRASRDIMRPVRELTLDKEDGLPPSVVIVGQAYDIGVAVAAALRKGIFTMLCATKAKYTVEIAEMLESILDRKHCEHQLPRLQKVQSFEESGVPSSSGYGMVAIVWDEDQADTIRDRFLRPLEAAAASSWFWIHTDPAIKTAEPSACAQLTCANGTSTASVRLGDPASARASKTFLNLGCMVTRYAASRQICPVDTIVKCVFESLADCGGSPASISRALRLPKACLEQSLPTSCLARLRLEKRDLPLADSAADDKARRFILSLCDRLLLALALSPSSAADGEEVWATVTNVDSLFVTCFGWPGQVAGPFNIFDERYTGAAELPEFSNLHAAVQNQKKRIMVDHPEVKDGAEEVAWSYSRGFAPSLTARDLIWPVLAYCAYAFFAYVWARLFMAPIKK
ncbi:Fatty acid oxidation complex subunit alpha [Diplonema papillatum]|nr:Fatty acid oxidation complex subunit alpha [Diplonema papillatum]